MKATIFAVLAACGGPSADDVFGADTTLEYVTRIGSPQQETCLEYGSFVLSGPNDSAALTLSQCRYGGIELDAATPLAVMWTTVDTPQDVAEDQSTVSGSVALTSSESNIPACEIAMTITRTNRYMNGTLVSALISWSGTVCGESVDLTREPY